MADRGALSTPTPLPLLSVAEYEALLAVEVAVRETHGNPERRGDASWTCDECAALQRLDATRDE